MLKLLGHLVKSILVLGFVEINELLKKFVGIMSNCWICWISVVSVEFMWFMLKCCWNVVEILLKLCWGFETLSCFYICQVISLLKLCWVSVGSLLSFLRFLLSFCWISVGFIWSVEFLLSFVDLCWVSVEFRVFRFSTDSTKSQQIFNRNNRNPTEKKSPKLNKFNTDSTE